MTIDNPQLQSLRYWNEQRHSNHFNTCNTWLPINIGSLPRWCAVEVGEITGYGYQGTQLSQNGFPIDDALEGAGSHNLPIFA